MGIAYKFQDSNCVGSNFGENFDLSVSEDLNSRNSNWEWSEKSEEGFNCREKNSDVLNPNLSETRVCDVEEKGNDSRVESTLAKDCIQMTPIETKLDEIEGNTELHNTD